MTTAPTPKRTNRRRIWIPIVALVAIAAIAVVGFAVWFLRDDAPDEVSLDVATAQVAATTSPDTTVEPATGSTSTSTPTSVTESSPSDGSLDGTWTVDTSIGEFSYEDATGSFVGFRIAEELSGIGDTEAVGRTPDVTGTITIDGASISAVTIEAEMTTITTNESRRDDNVQSSLDTDEFPTATFVLTEPIELPAAAESGEQIAVDAIGELTIHGVTQSVTFPLEAQLVDDTIVVVGSLDITFADYDVDLPSAPVVISVDDHGPIELQLFFTR